MPKIKVSHVVSFSSEDQKFPASNLLKSEHYRKWKCKDPGEKEASVILQLEKAEKITSIDIGNECSAFVEVLVGRSSQSLDDFKVLLLTSSFMTPMESKNSTNTNRVRMFSSDKLEKTVHAEKWDRIKVVCTQPFNKHVQYGLSFITCHSDSEQDEPKGKLLFGGFALKEAKKEEEIKAGSLFAGYKEKQDLNVLKGAAAIREASTSEGFSESKAQSETKALLKEIGKKKKVEGDNDVVTFKNHIGSSSENKGICSSDGPEYNDKQTSTFTARDIEKNAACERNGKKDNSHNSENQSQKRLRSPEKLSPSQKKGKKESDAPSNCQRKSFKKLLEGVVFVISGFQNPLRGEIRAKALEMGAKYKPDWDNSCTHLVCAFPNTPKFMQVLGRGHIVNNRWIEDSYSKRRRLPWRRYAMAKHEQGKEESEEEILEESDAALMEDRQSPDYSSPCQGAPSGSDTDDEINRCLRVSVTSDVVPACTGSPSRNSECYKCDTEDESGGDNSEATEKNGKLIVPHFPDFFSGYVFYVHPKLDSKSRYELNRHIVAYKGKVVHNFSAEVTHAVVNEDINEVSQLPLDKTNANIVKTEWIWDCHDAGMLISPE